MPTLSRMFRQLSDMEERARSDGASEPEIYHMLDGLLTNYISDLKKDDPEYEKKWVYFHPFLESGHFPDSVETFERKGHGKINVLGQGVPERTLPPYRMGGRKTRGNRKRVRRTYKLKRRIRQ